MERTCSALSLRDTGINSHAACRFAEIANIATGEAAADVARRSLIFCSSHFSNLIPFHYFVSSRLTAAPTAIFICSS